MSKKEQIVLDDMQCVCTGSLVMKGTRTWTQTGDFVAGGRARGYHETTIVLSCTSCGLLYDHNHERFDKISQGLSEKLAQK